MYSAWDLRYFRHWLVLALLPDPAARYTPWTLKTYIGLWIRTNSAISCFREALTQKVLHPPFLLLMEESPRQPTIDATIHVNSNSVVTCIWLTQIIRIVVGWEFVLITAAIILQRTSRQQDVKMNSLQQSKFRKRNGRSIYQHPANLKDFP